MIKIDKKDIPAHLLKYFKPSLTLKPKDEMLVPFRVADALQRDGWWVRSDIIWHKPNPMPESVTDRPTKAHEYLFLLTKSKTYYYDQDAFREGHQSTPGKPREKRNEGYGEAFLTPLGEGERTGYHPSGRNKRTVWTIPTAPYSGAHFATFPPALVEPCIKAGTSERGVCPECGNPWERVVERTNMKIKRSERTHELGRTRSSGTMEESAISNTIGWQPTCEHNIDPIPATVLDPFSGSGTTLLVARKLGRKGIGLDIAYQDLAKERLGLKALEEWENGKLGETSYEDLPLFDNIK